MASFYWAGAGGAPAGNGMGNFEDPTSWAMDIGLTVPATTYPKRGDMIVVNPTDFANTTTTSNQIDADVVLADSTGLAIANTNSLPIVFTGIVNVGIGSEVYSSSNVLIFRPRVSSVETHLIAGRDGLYHRQDSQPSKL